MSLFLFAISMASFILCILPSVRFDHSKSGRDDPYSDTPFTEAEQLLPATEFDFGPVVHIVTTRFMQFQPTLIELGFARLALFRSFCLPTMVQQSKQNFIWIIQTDPKLDKRLLEEMISLLRPYPHFILLASNNNSHNFRREFGHGHVLCGNFKLLEQATRLSQDHIFIETRLDADDGLNLGLLQHVENVSFARLSDPRVPAKSRWLVFCIDRHFEWHSHDDSREGALIFVAEAICVTPGLSFAMAPETSRSSVPKGAHNLLVLKVSRCKLPSETGCLYRMDDIVRAAALRARTLTSAGMANVRSNERSSLRTNNTRDLFWEVASRDLGIDRDDVTNTKAYLDSKTGDIARENLEGQWYVHSVYRPGTYSAIVLVSICSKNNYPNFISRTEQHQGTLLQTRNFD
jgi:hypothetical protein